ncbi:MAG: pantoate--beta-alanine ligase [Ilumatobacteraceae bacterium]
MNYLPQLTTPSDALNWATERHREGSTIALVPTMGALHQGHAALIQRANELCDLTVVSIFVNPTQFDRTSDFDTYPRTLDDDIALCATTGVNAVYTPTAEAMYPAGFDTSIDPGALATRWEGEHRAGHFSGVATVVTKLFTAVQPDIAVFGEKDFQQLAIIKHVVRDLGLAVEIVGEPTVRETDGLAMSSRNVRLAPDARKSATAIHCSMAEAIRGATPNSSPTDIIEHVDRSITEAGGTVEYVAVVDPDTLEPVTTLKQRSQLLVAAWFGDVRLIDNSTIPSQP